MVKQSTTSTESSMSSIRGFVISANNPSAGVTDSALTIHGILQANRLGSYLATTAVKVSHIFSSDLQRAAKTAEIVLAAQPRTLSTPTAVKKDENLREQDFGDYEGKAYRKRSKNNTGDMNHNLARFKDVESKEAMRTRMDIFIDTHLQPLFHTTADEDTVVVVAHGIILIYLWQRILARFLHSVAVSSGVLVGDRGLHYPGIWSNTGYMDLEIKSIPTASIDSSSLPLGLESKSWLEVDSKYTSPPLTPSASTSAIPLNNPYLQKSLVVKSVNNLEHLRGVKKTRGGIGSSAHDSTQKTMDFFLVKKP
ncbi:hypothetical protein B7494_g7554 [Chlorociboria aeruginascens]|nr:hypothetical protein B7494_g7554 [Chlorociboria aeruginascens]